MKKINIGDKIKVTNEYREIKEECIFLGCPDKKNPNYIAVAFEVDGITKIEWLLDAKNIELVATVNYTPIPKFHKGDKAFWKQRELLVVEERSEDFRYLCYEKETKTLVLHSEKDLLTEKEFGETLNLDYEGDGVYVISSKEEKK